MWRLGFVLEEYFQEGVSMKWWFFLWWRRWLNPTLNWKIYRRFGLWIPKVGFICGRWREMRCFLSFSKVGSSLKSVMTLFQLFMASGKKLLRYLSVPCIVGNWLWISIWGKYLEYLVCIWGSFSLRYEGNFSSSILCIWNIHCLTLSAIVIQS